MGITIKEIKKNIIENGFVNNVRCEIIFNESEYKKLISFLEKLSDLLKKETVIDKDLALFLYTLPQIIRNSFLSFSKDNQNEIKTKLEDAWLELDNLVLNCLN